MKLIIALTTFITIIASASNNKTAGDSLTGKYMIDSIPVNAKCVQEISDIFCTNWGSVYPDTVDINGRCDIKAKIYLDDNSIAIQKAYSYSGNFINSTSEQWAHLFATIFTLGIDNAVRVFFSPKIEMNKSAKLLKTEVIPTLQTELPKCDEFIDNSNSVRFDKNNVCWSREECSSDSYTP
ncbi:MAG: hypothetical protein KDD45_03500 [Bdellovibrionales bacterium]|nr:hypothetical protein [Bdellovibrionales bacterium]